MLIVFPESRDLSLLSSTLTLRDSLLAMDRPKWQSRLSVELRRTWLRSDSIKEEVRDQKALEHGAKNSCVMISHNAGIILGLL